MRNERATVGELGSREGFPSQRHGRFLRNRNTLQDRQGWPQEGVPVGSLQQVSACLHQDHAQQSDEETAGGLRREGSPDQRDHHRFGTVPPLFFWEQAEPRRLVRTARAGRETGLQSGFAFRVVRGVNISPVSQFG